MVKMNNSLLITIIGAGIISALTVTGIRVIGSLFQLLGINVFIANTTSIAIPVAVVSVIMMKKKMEDR